jgi:hypothetical protein
VVHNLELIRNARNVIEIQGGGIFAYKSNFRDDMGVVLFEDASKNLVIVIIPEEGDLDFMIIREAIAAELSFLSFAGVIEGLSEEDISSIVNEADISSPAALKQEYDTKDYSSSADGAYAPAYETLGEVTGASGSLPSYNRVERVIDLPDENIMIRKSKIISPVEVQNPLVQLVLLCGISIVSYVLLSKINKV